jgi:uroporphyrin-III C-methyltransferase
MKDQSIHNFVSRGRRALRRGASRDFPLATVLFRCGDSNVQNPIIMVKAKGSITLVGAGPGDPDLLTVAAVRALDNADLIIADSLIPDLIIDLIRHKPLIISPSKRLPPQDLDACNRVKKHKRLHLADQVQEDLNLCALEALREGKCVVRLKQGDPFVFGRGGEEVSFFESHGFVPKVIPGISSAFSAPLLAGIPVTHRGIANQVLVITGQGRDGTECDVPEYVAHRTVVYLMCAKNLGRLCDRLLQAGYPEDIPAATIERASCPDEKISKGTLKQVAEDFDVAPPVVFVVGYVVDYSQIMSKTWS